MRYTMYMCPRYTLENNACLREHTHSDCVWSALLSGMSVYMSIVLLVMFTIFFCQCLCVFTLDKISRPDCLSERKDLCLIELFNVFES